MGLLGWILLLVAVAAVAYVLMRRSPGMGSAPPRQVSPPKPALRDELTSLGLSSVRAAQPVTARPEPVEHRASRSAAPAPSATSPISAVPSLTGKGPWAGDAMSLLLRSLAVHARRPAAVVRHDGARFEVVARTDGGPLTTIVGSAFALDAPSTKDAAALGGLAALVGGRARAVPAGDHVVLVGLGADKDESTLDRYGDLIAALSPSRTVKTDGRRDLEDDAVAPVGDAPVPRAVIIEQEQLAAQSEDRPLAFALVTLADAEEILTQHAPEDVAVASAKLRNRLEDADHVRRVEPFGDLLFGVFIARDPEGAAAWCQTLSASDPPLFIGAVAPANGEPQEVRDAAASALHDAYEQKRARVAEA